MHDIDKHIKQNTFSPIYLLFGEEPFLVASYAQKLEKAIIPSGEMNIDQFEGKQITPQKLIDTAETLPFLAQHRLVIAKETGLFTTGRKDDSEKIAEYLSQLPETTIVLFVEKDVDKRSRMYKQASTIGKAYEFSTPQEKDLIHFVVSQLKEAHKTIATSTAVYLLRTVAHQMNAVFGETQKLIAYLGERTEVTQEDIDAICTKSLQTKIFDLVNAIGNKNPKTALDIYANLLSQKESPLMVLTMIARQFRLMLSCAYLAGKGQTGAQIAQTLSLRSFIVRECLEQSKNFNLETLKKAMSDCLNTDIAIKTGQMGDKLAVETLIVQYCLA